jgi:phosphoribosylformimino-5-aminoimidazole carboxamide ribotide isomerase
MTQEFEPIPAIDLKEGRCVRLQEGIASRATEYSSDPVSMALHWEAQGATRLHLVDLDGAFTGQAAHLEIAKSIFRALKIPVQFGGGLRTLEQIETLLDLGAQRTILGTIAVDHPEVVEEAVRRHPDSIIVGIDARKGRVALRGWVDQTALTAVELARRMKNLGVQRVIYTDVARDGMLSGVNLEETENLCREAGIRVIASGGVSRVEDVRALWEKRSSGIEGVILGKALYDHKIDFSDLKSQMRSWQNKNN